jgi:hypothetical protein
VVTQSESYPARLSIDYSETLDRVTTFFRAIWAIPTVILLSLLYAAASGLSRLFPIQVKWCQGDK